jgi:hypothetical protein
LTVLHSSSFFFRSSHLHSSGQWSPSTYEARYSTPIIILKNNIIYLIICVVSICVGTNECLCFIAENYIIFQSLFSIFFTPSFSSLPQLRLKLLWYIEILINISFQIASVSWWYFTIISIFHDFLYYSLNNMFLFWQTIILVSGSITRCHISLKIIDTSLVPLLLIILWTKSTNEKHI